MRQAFTPCPRVSAGGHPRSSRRWRFLAAVGEDEGAGVLSALGRQRTSFRGSTVTVEPHAGRPAAGVTVVSRDSLPVRLLLTTGSESHVSELLRIAAGMGFEVREDGLFRDGLRIGVHDEQGIYSALGLGFLPPEVREGRLCEMDFAARHAVPVLISAADIRGTIHNHTAASDGTVPLYGMVLAAKDRGYEWIGVSDHSRSAFYAGGLDEEAVKAQHEEIDMLNDSLDGITVLKGIESDILEDGSLDYNPEILSGFDFVVASIHTHMDMDRKAMTKRIVKALRNPFTTILGHPTGRLLLSREPFCSGHWRRSSPPPGGRSRRGAQREPAEAGPGLEADGALREAGRDWSPLSPDAHTVEGLDDMAYGVMIARKGFLTRSSCLNAMDAGAVRRSFEGHEHRMPPCVPIDTTCRVKTGPGRREPQHSPGRQGGGRGTSGSGKTTLIQLWTPWSCRRRATSSTTERVCPLSCQGPQALFHQAPHRCAVPVPRAPVLSRDRLRGAHIFPQELLRHPRGRDIGEGGQHHGQVRHGHLPSQAGVPLCPELG